MRPWRTAAWASAIVAAAGIGLALAPVAHGQNRELRAQEPGSRVVQVLGGQGSWIGVSVRDVADDDVARMKLPAAGGVVVEEVTRESPAETAGVKSGDVIVEFDGERVKSTRQFTRLVQETLAGRKVQASVVRDGQRVPLSVEPRASGRGRYFSDFDLIPDFARSWLPPEPPAPPAGPAAPRPPAPPAPPAMYGFDFEELFGRGSARLGVTVGDLQPQLADYFAVKEGVLVTSVTSGSPAAKAGVKAGDVITTLNGATVTSPADLRQRTSKLNDGDEISLGIVRDKKPMTLKGKFEGLSQRRRTYTVL
jgi:serine protease Do